MQLVNVIHIWHHSEDDHVITHGNVDQAAHTSVISTPAFLRVIYGVGPPSADMERRYAPICLRGDDDDECIMHDGAVQHTFVAHLIN